MLAVALRNVPQTSGKAVNINVRGGVKVYGSRNIVVTGAMAAGAVKTGVAKQEPAVGGKRKAEEVSWVLR